MASAKKPPFQSKTVEQSKPLVDDKLKPSAELHLLIGGPYTHKSGKAAPYGHCALRLKTKAYDVLYDFGRYGIVTLDGWTTAHVSGGSAGDGILRVWTNAAEYIKDENALLRRTTAVAYQIYDHQVAKAKALMDQLIKEATPVDGKSDEYMNVYLTRRMYHATGPNCTTVSVDGAEKAIVRLMDGQEKYWKPADVLTGVELKLVLALTDESRLFLPENLRKFLLEGCKMKMMSVTIHETPKPPKPPEKKVTP